MTDASLTNGWLGHELLFLGLPMDVMASMTRAASGSDPAALMALSKSLLGGGPGLTRLACLCAAESPALMAALIGGEPERLFLAELIEAQADALHGDERRGCLLQALSVFEALRDDNPAGGYGQEIARLLNELGAV